jgi:hypothetical protein
VYHDYFDDADTSGLRNPYGPEVPLLHEERISYRQRLLLLGMVGAGLSVAVPAAGNALAGPGRIAAADSAQAHRTGSADDGVRAHRTGPAHDHPDGVRADGRS